MSLEERIAQLEGVLASAASQSTAGQTDYQKLNALFSRTALNPTGIGTSLGIGKGVQAQPVDYISSPTGAIKYPGIGVIADPNTQAVYFPTHRDGVEDIEGSEEWLRKIQKTWGDEKFEKWRKQLIRLGYDQLVSGGIAESGGAAMDVIEGLRQYHKARYLNGGEAIPLTPGGGKKNIRQAVREQVDFVSLKEEVKGWGEVPFGESLDPGTAEYFADRMLQKMTELARKHPSWTMEQVQTGATTRVQKEFIKSPGVEAGLEEAEDDEMSTALRDSIVSISQLGSI